MPPTLGGKSLVTSSEGMGYAGSASSGCTDVLRSGWRRNNNSPNAAVTAPAANAPRSLPTAATTAPQMNAPTPCDASKNDENVPTTDARSASDTPVSASNNSAGYMSDMPTANTIV